MYNAEVYVPVIFMHGAVTLEMGGWSAGGRKLALAAHLWRNLGCHACSIRHQIKAGHKPSPSHHACFRSADDSILM